MLAFFTAGLLALTLGVRHALEPDHLAAVSTLVVDELGRGRRRRLPTLMALGLSWGLGHLLSLALLGAALFVARQRLSARLDDALELLVALVLFALGVRSLRRARRLGALGPVRDHQHGPREHAHSGPADHVHVGGYTLARQPLFVGLVHGLAGSGAITALALTSMPSWAAWGWFMLCFGVGAALAMALWAGLGAALLVGALKLGRVRHGEVALLAAVGLTSTIYGLCKAWPLAERLLGIHNQL